MLTKRKLGGPVARALDFRTSDAEAFVDVCYHAILGRAPDRGGLDAYVAKITASPDREGLIAALRSLAMSEEAKEFREHHLASQRR